MFRHEGPSKSLAKNAFLAGFLAFIAGFCNSGGFILIGSFTSHVTGSVGRISTDVAGGNAGAAVFALLLVVMFFAGAFGSTLIIEAHRASEKGRGYGIALLGQALLLSLFVVIAGPEYATHPRLLDAEASILCFAMGMQNSLMTRLSGAVIRTTHLTGVVTDLAMETAGWYRWHRSKLKLLPMVIGSGQPAERPVPTRSILLSTIMVAFIMGGILGAWLTYHWSRWSMALPAACVFVVSGVAFSQGRRKKSRRQQSLAGGREPAAQVRLTADRSSRALRPEKPGG